MFRLKKFSFLSKKKIIDKAVIVGKKIYFFIIFFFLFLSFFYSCKDPSGSGSASSVDPDYSNAYLSNIIISNSSLSPVFSSETLNYSVIIANDLDSITITASSSAPNTKIEIQLNTDEWNTVESGIVSPFINMSIGTNLINIRTTAQDGISEKKYSISVYRLSASAYLSELSISEGSLDPLFNPYTLDYSVNIPNTFEKISITAVTPSTGETLSFRVNNGEWHPLISGAASPEIDIDTGLNIIDIIVKSEDNLNANTYSVNAYRLYPPPLLQSLSFDIGTLNPLFITDTMEYELILNNSENSLIITPVSENEDVKIQLQINDSSWMQISSGSSSEALSTFIGDNDIKIKLTTADGLSSSTYTVNAHRKSSNADLSDLSLSSGLLSPSFSLTETSYSAEVSSKVDCITVTAKASYSLSVINVQINGGEWQEINSGIASKSLPLDTGNNYISIEVTSEDESSQKTYNIILYKLNGDAYLSNLLISNATLLPSFSSSYYEYYTTVSKTLSSVTVLPTLTASDASVFVRINGNDWEQAVSGTQTNSLSLIPGENTVEIKVLAEDNDIVNIYEVLVSRPCHGAVDLDFNTGSGPDNIVSAVALQDDAKILIGGSFTSYNDNNCKYIARLNTDGSIDTTFQPNINGPVREITIQEDGKIIIGGEFRWFYSGFHYNIARLNSDGSIDNSFQNIGTGADQSVLKIVIQDDHKVLVGGRFYNFNDNSQTGLIRLLNNGSPDPLFSAGSGFNNLVSAISVQDNDKIVIGGWFTEYDGTSRRGIVRLEADGIMDTSFAPDSDFTQQLNSIALQSNGKILIGGWFSTDNWASRRSLGRMNSDASFDSSFFSESQGINGTIYDIALQDDGQLYIGGEFTSFNGITRRGIALINSDGSLDETFLETNYGALKGESSTASISEIEVQTDGKIIVCGNFTSFNGINRPYLIRLWGE